MSIVLNIFLGMVIVKLTMSKVTQVISIAKDGVEVAKRGLEHIDGAKKAVSKATTVVKSTREYAELDARRAAVAPRPRRDYDVFS
jgi:hypothetical protein